MDIKILIEELRSLVRDEIQVALAPVVAKSDPLVPRTQAAEQLNIKPHTMAVWATRGTGPAPTKIGSRVFYRKSELDRFLDENTAPRRRTNNV